MLRRCARALRRVAPITAAVQKKISNKKVAQQQMNKIIPAVGALNCHESAYATKKSTGSALPTKIDNQNASLSPETTPSVAAALEKFAKDYSSSWRRPTPRPLKYHRAQPMEWMEGFPCNGPLPTSRDISPSGRFTAIGIGNAFGTGKTELALSGAEHTVACEKDVTVAYTSFRNGHSDPEIDAVLHHHTKNSFSGKYAGLWLFAAKRATRIVDGIVEGNAKIFKQVILFFLHHRRLPLPDYATETHDKLIVIFDDVQAFTLPELDGFVTDVVVTTETRMTLLVGAFSPSFAFPSGNRLLDCQFAPVSDSDMAKIFKQHVSRKTMVDNVSLPNLLSPSLRCAVEAPRAIDIMRWNDPVGATLNLFERSNCGRITPGILFRAAISGLPIGRRCLEKLFKRSNLSLGNAFMTPGGAGKFTIVQPPALISATNFALIDCEPECKEYAKSVLRGFARPTWQKFEALTGVALALRLAALTHDTEMEYDFGGKKPHLLEFIFKDCIKNKSASELLKRSVLEPRNGLKVRRVSGGSNVHKFRIHKYLDPSVIVLVTMDCDQDSTFDNFLLVPMADGKFVCLCTDAKYTESNGYLDYTRDVKPKIQHYNIHKEVKFFPRSCDAMVVIISSKHLSYKFPVDDDHAVPLVVCGRQQLGSVLSHALVPPKCRWVRVPRAQRAS